MLDQSTEFGAHAARRLREEVIGWLTTVTARGAPRPIPVWFLWDGDRSILLYSRPEKRKLENIAANPNVSLNLDSDGVDADIVICWGEIRGSDDPPANQVPEYVEKYAERIAALGWTPESFAGDFSVPLRIEISRIHGW
ncbi:MAG TPA: TIGR03667 family PPOX class F420-dependent oxidoreductase [Gaiellaceae bacterium]|nr:TIGR03667 family PPOX class F420-dependent oxidoreductase [Gaiellaceae bacterium]